MTIALNSRVFWGMRRVALLSATLALSSIIRVESARAQSPGLRVTGALSGILANPVGVGVFLDFDASPRTDVRLSFDASSGQGSDTKWVGGCGIVCDPDAAPPTRVPVAREVLSVGLAVPVMLRSQPSMEWRVVPGVYGSSVSGADGYLGVGMELGLETRLKPAATGRFEWIAQTSVGVSNGFEEQAADAGAHDRDGGYIRVALGLRFRLSIHEFTGLP